MDPRRRRGVPRDPALCRPGQWYHTGTGGGGLRRGQSGEVRQVVASTKQPGTGLMLTAPEPGEQVPSQDDHPRTTTETVLREAMQALVRVQAHMLARIVVEIRAADIAVELEPQL